MHQIRVHLQHLGYPIANDPVYNLAVLDDGTSGRAEDWTVDRAIANLTRAASARDAATRDAQTSTAAGVTTTGATTTTAGAAAPATVPTAQVATVSRAPPVNECVSERDVGSTPGAGSMPPATDTHGTSVSMSNIQGASAASSGPGDGGGIDTTSNGSGDAAPAGKQCCPTEFLQRKHEGVDWRHTTYFHDTCEECQLWRPHPQPDKMLIFLHALRYAGPDWDIETPTIPPWACVTEHKST
eukprot:m.1136967 g.1136967  ORF g.1136967 m.1136967 type:complete len:241 (+) comp24433_c0_seq18:1250-1972(+)